jgi:sugar/nucleoside kinase (ribokinase family)
VVVGQHLMQAESDIFLGWTRITGPDGVDRDFYVRQLKDWKLSFPIEAMRLPGMTVYAGLCGWTLARAHARSGDRVALAAYLGGSDTFDQAIADFAETYADQNELDYAALQGAVKDGRAEATTEI